MFELLEQIYIAFAMFANFKITKAINNMQMSDNQLEKIKLNQEKLERLREIMRLSKFKDAIDLAKAIGISQAYMSEIFSGKKGVPKTMGQKLEDHININRRWFDTGVGNIHLDSYSDQSMEIVNIEGDITQLKRNVRSKKALIPYYNADFMAGNSDVFYEDGTIYPEYYMDVPEFYGCTAFRAYSDSMEPKIRSGAILFGVKVDDWRSSLEYGQIYGITLNDGRRFLKYIRRSTDYKNEFILKSENDKYDDFEVTKDKIKNIWLIEGWLDKRT